MRLIDAIFIALDFPSALRKSEPHVAEVDIRNRAPLCSHSQACELITAGN
jgi:hypothetical protein